MLECQTADDVRNAARAVYQRRREFEEKLRQQRAQAERAQAVVVPIKPVEAEVEQPTGVAVRRPYVSIATFPSYPTLGTGTLRQLVLAHESAVRAILEEVDVDRSKAPPTVNKIQRAVAAIYRITTADLMSKCRAYSGPRQLSYALCRKLTGQSLPMIGKLHGGKDHTTVLHGAQKLAWITDKLAAELGTDAPVEAWVRCAVDLLAGARA